MNTKWRLPGSPRPFLFIALMVGILLMSVPDTYAAGIIVTTTADEQTANGQCSLREAIINANNNNQSGSTDCAAGSGADTITFSVSGTITLSSQLPSITDAAGLTIDGAGQSVTISGNNAVRVFRVVSYGALNLQNLAVTNANSSTTGGALLNLGMLNVTNCTFAYNSGSQGGGFQNSEGGTAMVVNSTFDGNTATIGGGIANFGSLIVVNSTFSGNGASIGGGIRNAGTATISNTIIVNSTAGGNCAGAITNGGNNIDDGVTCGWGSANGSMSNTDPQLGPLADNGGPTWTFGLLAGSPAIDGVTHNPPNNCPATDQRGYARPVDGDRDGSALCDIGAFEYQGYFIYLPLILRGP